MTDSKAIHEAIVSELGQCLARVEAEQVAQLADAIDKAPRVFLAAAGRSALGVRGFTMRLMHLGMQSYMVGDTTTPGIAKGDLLLIGSGSGSTASLLASANKAKGIGATIALVTIDPKSPIAQLADVIVQIPAPSPKAANSGDVKTIQPMGSLFEQSLFLLLDGLVITLMQKRSLTTDDMFKRHANLE